MIIADLSVHNVGIAKSWPLVSHYGAEVIKNGVTDNGKNAEKNFCVTLPSSNYILINRINTEHQIACFEEMFGMCRVSGGTGSHA